MNSYFTLRSMCPCCQSSQAVELCRAPYTQPPLRDDLLSFYSPQGQVELAYLQDQDFILDECPQCGLIYQREIPDRELMARIYGVWINPQKSLERKWRKPSIDYLAGLSSEIIHVIHLLNRTPADLKMLDFSMGWGYWCKIAQSFGCTVHGTELEQSRIDFARSHGVQVIDQDQIAEHTYDFINTEQVFEHLPDIRSTLAFLKRSLKPKGLLKISVPNGGNMKERLKAWNWQASKASPYSLNPVAPLEHVNCFCQQSLLTLAHTSGLELYEQTSVRMDPRLCMFFSQLKA